MKRQRQERIVRRSGRACQGEKKREISGGNKKRAGREVRREDERVRDSGTEADRQMQGQFDRKGKR